MSLWYLSGHIQYLRYTVSIGNRFPWLYINCFESPWLECIPMYHHWICYFPLMGMKRGGGMHVSKERRDEKGKEGELIHLYAICLLSFWIPSCVRDTMNPTLWSWPSVMTFPEVCLCLIFCMKLGFSKHEKVPKPFTLKLYLMIPVLPKDCVKFRRKIHIMLKMW